MQNLPLTLNILRKFGRQPLTGRDFIILCDLNSITVKLTSTVNRGFYYFTHDRHYIALSTRLKADQRRLVGWHEFAHFLENYYLRKPVAAFADLEPDRPSEKLANIFAAIAVNPAAIGITRPLDFVKMLMETKV